MTKTLRVDLADLEGIPHASGPSGTSVVVTAEYTSPVVLEADGTIILAPKSKTMGASGRVDFDGIYASDSEDVREDHRGFAVRVKVEIREPNGATRAWARTVKPLEHMTSTVRLGRMPSAQGLPPQWVTVDEILSDFTERIDTKADAEHGHTIDDVEGLAEQISGEVEYFGSPLSFGPGAEYSAGEVIGAALMGASDAAAAAAGFPLFYAPFTSTPGFVTVVTGNEERPIGHPVVFWIGGSAEPINMDTGDVWLEQ